MAFSQKNRKDTQKTNTKTQYTTTVTGITGADAATLVGQAANIIREIAGVANTATAARMSDLGELQQAGAASLTRGWAFVALVGVVAWWAASKWGE